MTKEKNYSFLAELSNTRAAIMGIAIIWIMLFHSGIQAPDNKILCALWYIFVSFGGGIGVNLFFILSGFGLYYSVSKYPDIASIDWLTWGKKRLVRLLPSYLIVSVLYFLLKGDLSVYNILWLNFWIDGVRDFWFIPGIAVCYLLFPAIYILAKKCGFGKVTVILLLILVLGNFLFEVACTDYFAKIEIFTWRLPCFVIGVYLGYLTKEKPQYKWKVAYIIALVLLVLSFVLTNLSRPTFVVLTILFLPVLTWIVTLIKWGLPWLNTALDYCGSRSLQIYLLHVSIVPLLLTMIWRFDLILYFILSFLLSEILYRLTSLIKMNPEHKHATKRR